MSVINRIAQHLVKNNFTDEDAHMKSIQVLNGMVKVSSLGLKAETEKILEELKEKVA